MSVRSLLAVVFVAAAVPVAAEDVGPCGSPAVLAQLAKEEAKILHFYGSREAKRGPIEVDYIDERTLVCFSSYDFPSRARLSFAYRITHVKGDHYSVVIDPRAINWSNF